MAGQHRRPFHRGDRFLHAFHQKAVASMLDHFRRRAVAPGDDRRSRRHRLDHHEAKWFRPVDREEHGARAAEECGLVGIADLADELDQRVVEQRLDLILEISGVGVVDLGSDLQLHAGAPGDLDRAVGTLLRRDPPDKGEIVASPRTRRDQIARHAVMDGRDEIGADEGQALIVGDRHQLHLRKGPIGRMEIGQILPPVQGGDALVREMPEGREMEKVEVKVDDVEFVLPAHHLVEHGQQAREMVVDPAQAQAGLRTGDEIGGSDQIAAGEQGDVVAEIDQAFGQPPDDPLGSAIKLRRHQLGQGSDVGDTHAVSSSRRRGRGEADPHPGPFRTRTTGDEVPRFAGAKRRTDAPISAVFQEASAPVLKGGVSVGAKPTASPELLPVGNEGSEGPSTGSGRHGVSLFHEGGEKGRQAAFRRRVADFISATKPGRLSSAPAAIRSTIAEPLITPAAPAASAASTWAGRAMPKPKIGGGARCAARHFEHLPDGRNAPSRRRR